MRLNMHPLHRVQTQAGPNTRAHAPVRARLEPLISGLVLLLGIWLLVTGSILEDRRGQRTLSFVGFVVRGLREVGLLEERIANFLMSGATPIIICVALGLCAGISYALLRRGAEKSWYQTAALAVLFPSLALAAVALLRGQLLLFAVCGVICGCAMLGAGVPGPAELRVRYLWLIPMLLGAALRFYALAEIPNGYAEHAAGQHAELTLPYLAGLKQALVTGSALPFWRVLENALLREHAGPFALLDAIGFQILGVSALISRLISAALGVATIYVAYRLGRALAGEALGFLFCFLIAVSPWQISIARYATTEHVHAPLQFLLAVLFAVKAIKTSSLWHALLAALLLSTSWIAYATNLVVPIIVGCLVVYWASRNRSGWRAGWLPAALGFLCFAGLSYVLLSKSFPNGILQPSFRTGYTGSGALLSQWPKRLETFGAEVNQLLLHANDPWYATQSDGGLSLIEAMLLIPGVFLAAHSLRRGRFPNLGLLICLGLPIAVLPAVFAPDASFRRMMLVATLATLATAFAILCLAKWVARTGISRSAQIAIAIAGLLLVAANGAFTYFDRVALGEEQQNAWFRELAEAAVHRISEPPIILVVPRRDNEADMHRYMQLIRYDSFRAAQTAGIPRGELYTVTSCEDAIGSGHHTQVYARPPVLLLAEDVPNGSAPCGQPYLQRLSKHFAGSAIVTVPARPPLPPDLEPAP